jgi:MFS family permease
MKPAAQRSGLRTFFLVWGSQLVSVVGSGMTRFGLAIWIFRESDSVTSLAMVILAGTVPALVVGPFAGTVVDRSDRRLIMMVADTVAGLSSVALAVLWLTGNLQLWHILAVAILGATSESFQQPAYLASVTLLVPKDQLNRANGLMNVNQGLGLVLTPVLAGVLMGTVGLGGVLLVDVATFLVAVATLLVVRFPRPEPRAAAGPGRSFYGETAAGLRYLGARTGLLLLLFFAAALNFLLGFTNVLAFPLLLSFTTEAVVGTVTSVIGAAMLAGSVLASSWGGPRHRVRFMLSVAGVGGLCVAISGLRASAVWIGGWSAGLMLLLPLFNATSQALWQTKVAPDYQGRVFATRRVVASMASPIAFLLAGPLADRVFEPWLADGGALAGSVGALIGTGPGRGIGFMFVVMGLGLVAISLAGFVIRPLHEVETRIPDAIP